jgi:uncharacterized protein (DUF924 family)
MDHAATLLEYWFGRSPPSARALEERMRFWFGGSDPEDDELRDREIATRFGPLVERAAAGRLANWAASPRRLLALILLLDQLPRNLYRGTAEAFAHDREALAHAFAGLQLGADAALAPVERIFFYLPLQHSESLEVQDESVALYRRLVDEAPPELRPTFESTLEFAQHHRSIVERFGRFPHRNRALGRTSTPEESAWLRKDAESFGQ